MNVTPGALSYGGSVKEEPETSDAKTHRENPSDVHKSNFSFYAASVPTASAYQ
jgi:hypothetical protein